MHKLRLVFYTSTFRPLIGTDMGLTLIDAFLKAGHSLALVIGPAGDELEQACTTRGIPYHPALPEFRIPSARLKARIQAEPELAQKLQDWLEPIRQAKADLGVLYFSTWIPAEMISIPRLGFINFHPAPLPELRGFLPEDFALLWGWKTMCGTLHRVTENIDEGPILGYSRKARLSLYDTPDTVMQKVGETATGIILRGIQDVAQGKPGRKQNLDPGFDAGYGPFYPESYLNWENDSHPMLQRRYQVFRGQNHRVCLKAKLDGEVVEVLELELHRFGAAPGKPGQVLCLLDGKIPLVRTTEGVAVLLSHCPLVRDPKLAAWLDHPNEAPLEAGRPKNRYSLAQIKKAIALS